MTLGDAKVGSTVVVTKIEGDSAYKRRIIRAEILSVLVKP